MTTPAELDERYGRTHARRTVWIVGGVLAAAALALGVWWASSGMFHTVEATDLGYEVVDEHSVAVRFAVTSATAGEAHCALQALDEEFGVVGWKIIQVPTGPQPSGGFNETIPTVALATTGLVHSCWLD